MMNGRNICIVESNLRDEEYKKFLEKNGFIETVLFSELTKKEDSIDKRVIIVEEKELNDFGVLENIMHYQKEREIILLVWDFEKFQKYYQSEYRKIEGSLFMIEKVNQTIYLGAEMRKKT